MTLRLSIENVDRLPDGGPLRIEVKGRGLDLGRDAHLDWTLPDPSRTVSSKHCEIRFREEGYWLHDVSLNGTSVNGSPYRLDAPYLLRDGDRLSIGPYIIAVSVEGRQEPGPIQSSAAPLASAADVWDTPEEAAAPDDRAAYQAQKPQARSADFLDCAALIEPAKGPVRAAGAPRETDAWEEAPIGVSAPAAAAQPPRTAADLALLSRIARAAGIPERTLAGRDPNVLADEIGLFMRLTAQNLAEMLAARAESKTLIRSSSRTMVRALENNPLKFTSSVEDALAIMFGAPARQYLDARATIESSFSDLKTHQVLTFGAMRAALDALFEDLAPERIDHSVEPDHGLVRFGAGRKAKLWDIYVERWRAKTKRADGRLLEAFMALLAEAYDRLQDKGK